MEFTIETSNGYVKTISTIGGELNQVTEYTNDRNMARKFTEKKLKSLRARSFFKYYSMSILIEKIEA